MSVENNYLFDDNKKSRGGVRILLKLLFIVLVCVLVFLTILANMGGSGDTYRSAVENVISNNFKGRAVEVETLTKLNFFPSAGVDFENARVMSKPEGGYAVASVAEVKMFAKLWSVVAGTPRVSSFYIENFQAIKGVVAPQSVTIEKAFIDHDHESKTARLRAFGVLGEETWSLSAALHVHGSVGGYSYAVRQPMAFELNVADIAIRGETAGDGNEYLKVENFTVQDTVRSLQGTLYISAIAERMLKVKTELVGGGADSVSTSDVVIDMTGRHTRIMGDDPTQDLTFDEVIGDETALYFIQRLSQLWTGDVVDFNAVNAAAVDADAAASDTVQEQGE